MAADAKRRGRGPTPTRCRRGATAVEFALVAPVFLIMVLGTIELSRALWIKATMQFAMEETSRYALVNTGATTSTLESYATTIISNYGVPTSGMTVSATSTATYISIQASYTFQTIIPLLSIPDISLTAMSRVPISSS